MFKKYNDLKYIDQMHFLGKFVGLIVAMAITLFPVAMALIFNASPKWDGVLKGILGVAPLFWTVGIIEIFTYIPMVGVGGGYLAFVTGNLSNLKIPCVLNSLESANTSIDSEEGEVIATISISVSSILTTLIISLGVLLISLITPVKEFLASDTLKPCFDNILPALFGGLAVVYVSRNFKISIAPIVLMLILFIAVPALNSGTVGIMVPVGALVAIGVSRILYVKGWLTGKHPKENTSEENASKEAIE